MERGYIENPQRLCGCFPPRGSTNAKMLQVPFSCIQNLFSDHHLGGLAMVLLRHLKVDMAFRPYRQPDTSDHMEVFFQ